MPKCIKCGRDFTRKTRAHRKQCYDCQPFGLTGLQKDRAGECTCSVCGRQYIYDRQKGHTRTKCGTCSVNERRFDIKKKAVEYKGGKCCLCGYAHCFRALVFHHEDETKKEFGVGGNHCRKWEDVKKELDKCHLLCANCHAEVHEGLVKLPPLAQLGRAVGI
jgi:hypothetical protein